MATLPAQALEPSEKLADPALEERARDLSAELRCLVCQNQSIDDSDAPLARDLRLLVRERLVAGDSNAEVKSFIVARYGDFVLLKPPFNTHTFLLWLTPLIVLLLVGFTVFRASRRQQARQATAVAELSADEQRRLGDVLKRYE
ncbi:MAG: cytochrome c-type biogenesis protein CcmH [Hyphomicrobiaceae bacterium]|nr:cytochrome c-type biogenesis protein CcmH [Hyphomicrobiaceae bacterium]